METAPVVEPAVASLKEKERRRRRNQTHASIPQNMAMALVTLITIVVSAVIFMVWFGIGPPIPLITSVLKLLFHALGR